MARHRGPGAGEMEEVVRSFSRVPWENLTKILAVAERGEGPAAMRSPEEVLRGYRLSGTGGTCFSLVATLERLLTARGYSCTFHMADMRSGRDLHCALVVGAEGCSYLADPGYLVPEPVRLDGGGAPLLELPGQTMQWRPDGSGERLELHTRGGAGPEWKLRYSLSLRPVSRTELEEHWVRSFSAAGMRVPQLGARREGERLYARGRNLRLTSASGSRNEKLRTDVPGLVRERFGLAPAVTAAALARLEEVRCRKRETEAEAEREPGERDRG